MQKIYRKMLAVATLGLSVMQASATTTLGESSASEATDGEMLLYGTVVCSGDGSGVVNGLYSFDLTEAGPAPKLLKSGLMAAGGGFYAKGKFYFNSETEVYDILYWYHNVYTFPQLISQSRKEFDKGIDMANDLAYDATTGLAFGCFPDGESMKFGYLDPATFEVTRLGDQIETEYTGVAADDNGQIYAIDKKGELFKIDKFTGKAESVGQTELTTAFQTSAIYNPASGKILYGVQKSAESALYSVDPATAEAVKLFDFPNEEQVTGFFFHTTARPLAPASVKEVAITPDGATTNYTVSFTMPTNTADGTGFADAALTYLVMVNGEQAASAEAQAGTEVNIPLSIATPGKVYVSVFAVNASGRSEESTCSAWIGNDIPGRVPGISAVYDYSLQKFMISWQMPEGVNGGYVDPEQVSYTVVRYPDGITVADGISECQAEDQVALPDEGMSEYYYGVRATCNGQTGEEGNSDIFRLGLISCPYSNALSSADDLTGFTIIPNNNSFNNVWIISGSAAKGPNKSWLVMPPMKFEPDIKYTLKFSVRSENGWDTESYKVCLGASPEAAAMTRIIFDGEIDQTSFKTITTDFRVDSEQIGFLGIVDYTRIGTAIRVKNISLTAELSGAGEIVTAQDDDAPVTYYNLQGVQVEKPEGGVYIRVQGNNAAKVLIH